MIMTTGALVLLLSCFFLSLEALWSAAALFALGLCMVGHAM